MSTSFSYLRLYRTPGSLRTGLGELKSSGSFSELQLTFRSRTKKKDIYVISTPMRPVPLEHFLWAGKELHKIVDSKSHFLGTG